jgi:hypothetical protein
MLTLSYIIIFGVSFLAGKALSKHLREEDEKQKYRQCKIALELLKARKH